MNIQYRRMFKIKVSSTLANIGIYHFSQLLSEKLRNAG